MMTSTCKCSVFKVNSIVIFLILFSVSNCQLLEGSDCTFKRSNLSGICTSIKRCKSAQDDLRFRRIVPQVCGISEFQVLVCCSTDVPSLTSSSASTSTESYIPPKSDDCPFPNNAINVKRDAWPQKSWNKCIDLANSVFPCVSPQFNLNGSKIRMDTCQYPPMELIVEGAAKLNEFPHMAALGYENNETTIIEWKCGGALISEQWVISPAHCFYDTSLKAEVSRVRLGGNNLRFPVEPKFIFTIIRKIKHPDFAAPKFYNDLLLLMLDRRVQYSKIIRPACLHVGDDVQDNETIATEYITTRQNQTNHELTKVVLNKLSHEECSQKVNPTRRYPDGFKNATQECYVNRDAVKYNCEMSSGGPLQIYNRGVHCTYTVIGITTAGRICGGDTKPKIYTRISAYISWIESVVWPN